MLLKRLTLVGVILTLGVIMLGAYTRLTDAGLGCPDWPGCYGQLIAPKTVTEIDQAQMLYPQSPVDVAKAQTEMTHRYAAQTLGLLVIMIAVFAYRQRKTTHLPLWLPFTLVLLILFQGILGMWTVTLGLLPLVVMGHLLGGFATLSLLWLCWLHLNVKQKLPKLEIPRSSFFISHLLLLIVTLQILLGGWTSANYAALICPEFPTCRGEWLPPMDFFQAFNFLGRFMDSAGKTTIHLFHRLGAVITLLAALVMIKHLWDLKHRYLRALSVVLSIVLISQITLGISNVIFSLPLSVAVLHNAFAIILLLTLITIQFVFTRGKQRA